MSLMTSLTLMISAILMVMSSVISKKSMKDREKSSPFECGFDPYKSARLPFSLRFFMIAIIFLVFDVEITLLMPLPILFKISNLSTTLLISLLFFLVLLLGLYYEWKMGALEWAD